MGYTLECNYNTSKVARAITCTGLPETYAESAVLEPYGPSSWAQVGEALGVSILDLHGHNCWSRVPGSRFGTLSRLLGACPSFRESAKAVPFPVLASREKPCRGD